MTEKSDIPNFYELENYALAASFWYTHYQRTLEEEGSVMTYSGIYTSKEKLREDTENQINTMIEKGELIMNITREEALTIIFDCE